MKIIITFAVQSIIPFVNVGKLAVISKLKISADQKGKKDRYVTRTSTIFKYKDVYMGPEFPIHFRFADGLVIVFMTMLYGPAMPIMFPMAALLLNNHRISSRIVVAKYTR